MEDGLEQERFIRDGGNPGMTVNEVEETAAEAEKNVQDPAAKEREPITDVLGSQEFKTRISGRLIAENGIAYIKIDEYEHNDFRDALLKVITDGNSINKLDKNGQVDFRVTCADEKRSKFDTYGTFQLDFHSGRAGNDVEGECASLADSIEYINDKGL